MLGGRGGPRDRFVGETTRYVIEKAPCKVILTAPPAGEEGTREGVARPKYRCPAHVADVLWAQCSS